MNIRDKLNNLLQGRYGNDELNRFLLILYIILIAAYLFTGFFWLNLLSFIVAVIFLFRSFSKNYAQRSSENKSFLKFTEPVRRKFSEIRNSVKSGYRIFTCPQCSQKVRVPKGKGRIRVTCSKCGNRFEAKS